MRAEILSARESKQKLFTARSRLPETQIAAPVRRCCGVGDILFRVKQIHAGNWISETVIRIIKRARAARFRISAHCYCVEYGSDRNFITGG